jgi:predicted nucleotide-binding protein
VARERPGTRQEPPDQPALKASKARAKELIARGIGEANELLSDAEQVTHESYEDWTNACKRWDARTRAALDSVFEGPFPAEFERAARAGLVRFVNQNDGQTLIYRREALKRAINTLLSIEERLEFLGDPQDVSPRPRAETGNQVFVVHGHDELLREQVARLLSRLGLEALILSEQTDRGRTIIEKFEDHALDVGYAVVLMTADDYGSGSEAKRLPDLPNRARQNVILELGYFMGTLGRARVAALSTSDVEKPSDIHGVLYIPVDENWQLRLAKEMREAGLPVDLNAL